MKNGNSDAIKLVGGGLAGSLLAILLAEKGLNVELYERRPDMRNQKISAGRSINLALSNRGLKALKKIKLDTYMLNEAVPMLGRLVHLKTGTSNLQPYSGRPDLWINSVSRGGLNMALLSKAEEYKNIKILFNQKCLDLDFRNNKITFENELDKSTITNDFSVVIGTDGYASAVRSAMIDGMHRRFDYSQTYLEHGYKELAILPTDDGGFKLEKNALHIWPRADFMMIALPNFDGSFTCTLFMPYSGKNGFDNLNSKEKVSEFFTQEFADVMPLLHDLENTFLTNPTGALATVKCKPWNIDGQALLIGDAAHAVVPFYGQGMNASFEDCLLLDELIEANGFDWVKNFNQFSEIRKPNGDAVADLALGNYYEMRAAVADPVFVIKKQVELKLEAMFSDFNSKYSMVTFCDNISYSEAQDKGNKQDLLLMEICRKVSSVDELDLADVYTKCKSI